MWKIFSAKKKKPPPRSWGVMDSVLQLTASIQRKCCGWMNERSQHWSPRQVKTYFLLFCMLVVGSCVYILWDTFKGNGHMIVVSAGRVPVMPQIPVDPMVDLNEKEIASIIEFKQFLDSLQSTPAGRAQYDQLSKAHPGFIDSLKLLEQYFSQQ